MSKWTPKKLAAIEALYPLPGIRISYKRRVRTRAGKLIHKYSPAWANLLDAVALLPKPDTIYGLYMNLHERAHFLLRHFNECDAKTKFLADLYSGNGQLTETEQEYQAEQWAISTMRRHGVPVPKKVHRDAKEYVRACLRSDKQKEEPKPARHIRRWAKKVR